MPKFDLGTVFSRFFKLVGENLALFIVVGLIGVVLPSVAVSYVMVSVLNLSGSFASYSALDANAYLILGVAVLALIVFNLMTLSAITEVAIVRAVGKPVDIGVILGNGLRNALPLLAISILVTLFMMLGLILLIIPGIYLMICLCVAIPAYVGQPGIGIWGAIMKSFELTRGNRWWILLIGVVLFIASMILGGALGGVMLGFAMSGGSLDGMQTLPYQMANSAVSGISNLVGYIFAAATYVTLRESKEKLSPENAASVFS